jgi:hypothetical protein
MVANITTPTKEVAKSFAQWRIFTGSIPLWIESSWFGCEVAGYRILEPSVARWHRKLIAVFFERAHLQGALALTSMF